MLASFANYLFGWLPKLFNNFAAWLGGILTSLGNSVAGWFTWLGGVLSNIGQAILSGMVQALQTIFGPIFQIIAAFFVFVGKLGQVLFDLLKIIFQVAHVLFGLVWGVIHTIAGLTYNNSSPALPSDVSSPFTHMQSALGLLQLDNVAYALRFAVWIMVAFAAIRIISGWAGGGSD